MGNDPWQQANGWGNQAPTGDGSHTQYGSHQSFHSGSQGSRRPTAPTPGAGYGSGHGAAPQPYSSSAGYSDSAATSTYSTPSSQSHQNSYGRNDSRNSGSYGGNAYGRDPYTPAQNWDNGYGSTARTYSASGYSNAPQRAQFSSDTAAYDAYSGSYDTYTGYSAERSYPSYDPYSPSGYSSADHSSGSIPVWPLTATAEPPSGRGTNLNRTFVGLAVVVAMTGAGLIGVPMFLGQQAKRDTTTAAPTTTAPLTTTDGGSDILSAESLTEDPLATDGISDDSRDGVDATTEEADTPAKPDTPAAPVEPVAPVVPVEPAAPVPAPVVPVEPEPAPAAEVDIAAQRLAIRQGINVMRAAQKCKNLSSNSDLVSVATSHSAHAVSRIETSNSLDLTDGNALKRIGKTGYQAKTAAENTAKPASVTGAGFSSATEVLAYWSQGTKSRTNMLNCSFTHVGVGAAKLKAGGYVWTATFAEPK